MIEIVTLLLQRVGIGVLAHALQVSMGRLDMICSLRSGVSTAADICRGDVAFERKSHKGEET
jgi:hypothetical protein